MKLIIYFFLFDKSFLILATYTDIIETEATRMTKVKYKKIFLIVGIKKVNENIMVKKLINETILRGFVVEFIIPAKANWNI